MLTHKVSELLIFPQVPRFPNISHGFAMAFAVNGISKELSPYPVIFAGENVPQSIIPSAKLWKIFQSTTLAEIILKV